MGKMPALARSRPMSLRTGKGGYTNAQVKGFLNYVAYGQQRVREATPQRGTWLDQDGQPHDHETVLAWAKGQTHTEQFQVSYQLLLSLEKGQLTPKIYNQALAHGKQIVPVETWRSMVHTDTEHQHAHAVLFQKDVLKPTQYRAWHKEMQAELTRLQKENQQEQVAEVAEETASMGRGLSL